MRRECRSVTQAAAPMMSAAPLTKVVVIWLLRLRNFDERIALSRLVPRRVCVTHGRAQETDGTRGGEPEKRREQRVLDQVLAVFFGQPPVPDVRHCLTSSCFAPGHTPGTRSSIHWLRGGRAAAGVDLRAVHHGSDAAEPGV